jgi:hypothetical protein
LRTSNRKKTRPSIPGEGWEEYVKENVEARVGEAADDAFDERKTGLKAFPLSTTMGRISEERSKRS